MAHPQSAAGEGAVPPTLTLRDVREAQQRIRDFVHRTPVLTSATLDARTGAQLYFKCENLQRVGAFKARGAHNAILSLADTEARAGVITHSSGNHGAAVALAARNRGIPAYVVMPSTTAEVKKRAVARYGATITYCEPTLKARESVTERIRAESGAAFIHPYNDLRVIAGQGTAALELMEDVADLDLLLCPVGGGGLLSGVAVAAKGLRPGIRVIGVEPRLADDAQRSFRSGTLQPGTDPRTIADGLRGALGDKTFALIRAHVDDIVTVSEEAIVGAMRTVAEIMKIVIEPSSAVPVAALLEGSVSAGGGRVGVILTGGNVDLDRLPWLSA
jgi:threonine dehydratase